MNYKAVLEMFKQLAKDLNGPQKTPQGQKQTIFLYLLLDIIVLQIQSNKVKNLKHITVSLNQPLKGMSQQNLEIYLYISDENNNKKTDQIKLTLPLFFKL